MPEATTQRVLDLHVQPSISAAVSLSTDQHLLRTISGSDVAERGGIFRVYGVGDDVLSIGRYQIVPETGMSTGSVSACRRLTGGRNLPSGDGFFGVSIVLPHRSALVSSEPLALAPQQVMNRCVRGLLQAFKNVGIPAFYPGRDLVTVDRRALAAVSFEVAPEGSLLFEVIIASSRDFTVTKEMLSRAESRGALRAPEWGIGEVTCIKEQLGVEISIEELTEILVRGYEHQFDLHLRRSPEALAVPAPEAFSPDTWLVARGAGLKLDHHVFSTSLLGTVEAYFSLLPSGGIAEIILAGDFIASSGAIAELESALRGCLLERDAIDAVVAAVFSKPENFILGIGPLSSIADLLLSGSSGAPTARGGAGVA